MPTDIAMLNSVSATFLKVHLELCHFTGSENTKCADFISHSMRGLNKRQLMVLVFTKTFSTLGSKHALSKILTITWRKYQSHIEIVIYETPAGVYLTIFSLKYQPRLVIN